MHFASSLKVLPLKDTRENVVQFFLFIREISHDEFRLQAVKAFPLQPTTRIIMHRMKNDLVMEQFIMYCYPVGVDTLVRFNLFMHNYKRAYVLYVSKSKFVIKRLLFSTVFI